MTGLGAGRSPVGNPAGARNLSVLQNVQTGFRAHPASYSMHLQCSSWHAEGQLTLYMRDCGQNTKKKIMFQCVGYLQLLHLVFTIYMNSLQKTGDNYLMAVYPLIIHTFWYAVDEVLLGDSEDNSQLLSHRLHRIAKAFRGKGIVPIKIHLNNILPETSLHSLPLAITHLLHKEMAQDCNRPHGLTWRRQNYKFIRECSYPHT
jgi:hypothetical protein